MLHGVRTWFQIAIVFYSMLYLLLKFARLGANKVRFNPMPCQVMHVCFHWSQVFRTYFYNIVFKKGFIWTVDKVVCCQEVFYYCLVNWFWINRVTHYLFSFLKMCWFFLTANDISLLLPFDIAIVVLSALINLSNFTFAND